MLYPRGINAWIVEDEGNAISPKIGLFPLLHTCRYIRIETMNIRITTNTFIVRETKGHSLGRAHLNLHIQGFSVQDDVKTVEICIPATDVRFARGQNYYRLKMATLIGFKGVECVKVAFLPDVATAFGVGVGSSGLNAALLMMKSKFLDAGQRVEFVEVLPPKPERLFRAPGAGDD